MSSNPIASEFMRRLGLEDDLSVVLRGAGLTLIIQVTAVALNYGSQILLARWMGPFEFGVYAFAWSLVLPAAAAATLGLSGSAIRFVPQYVTSERWSRIRGLIRRSASIALGVGLGIVAAGQLLLFALEPWMAGHYIGPVRMALLSIPCLASIALLSGLSRGFGWVGLAYVPQYLLVPGLMVLSVVLFKHFVFELTAMRVLALAVGVCALTALWQAIRFRMAIPRPVRQSMPAYDTRLWVRVAVPLFLSDGVFLVLWSADEIMLGSMMGPDEVAIYHACVKTAGLTLVFFNATTALAAPRFAALWVDRDKAHQQQFARSVSRWMFFPTLAIALALIALGSTVLATFGTAFVGGYPVLIVLALGYLAQAATGPVSAYLAVSGNHDAIVMVTAAAAVTNVLFNLLLIPPFGVMGAAVASVLSALAYQLWNYLLVRRRLGIDAFFY
jgi:O-antigen/teichoic acid export membrane protein